MRRVLQAQKTDDAPALTDSQMVAEWVKCGEHPFYFIKNYCWLFNATEGRWMPFELWPAQAWAINEMFLNRLVVVLKARQLGLSWLTLSFALWLMLFRPAAVIGIFSRRETDARELLSERLRGMYNHLPAWMQAKNVARDSGAWWSLSNGSAAMAFPTSGGRQYTFAFVIVDEADFQPDLPTLMTAVKPTIDAGARMVLLSTVDKRLPLSMFKAMYRGGKAGRNEWKAIFLPWHARPARTREWYAAQERDTQANTGSLDDLWQEYPATDAQALSERTLDKRIPPGFIHQCFEEMDPIWTFAMAKIATALSPMPPRIPGLEVFKAPEVGRRYVIGADPAEGNPGSDPSAADVQDALTGEQMAVCSGKIEPTTFADYLALLSEYYNWAPVMVERNNHGHAVIGRIKNDHRKVKLLRGYDRRWGWMSNSRGKTLLYTAAVDTFISEDAVLHDFETQSQLASIEADTLRAPEGLHDDHADAWALANVGREKALTLVDDERPAQSVSIPL
ncbi:MAG: hypothetical protein KAZ26_24240 [Caldilineaceae bacterium]|nr:hypothetical protein [Caldilineaceae bacterium]